jgi:hypothetical protein
MAAPPRTLARLVVLAALVLHSTPAFAQLLRRATRTVQTGSSSSDDDEPRSRDRSEPTSSASSSAPRRQYQPASLSPCGMRRRWFPYAQLGLDWQAEGVALCGGQGWGGPAQVPSSPPVLLRAVVGVDGGLVLPTVGRISAEGRLDFGTIDFGTRYSWLMEKVDGGLDTVTFGRTEIGYNLIEVEGFNARLRGGVLHWVANGMHDFGISGGAAIEAFPGRSVTLNVEFGVGILGRASVLYGRALVGTMLGHFELAAGWDHTSLLTDDGSPPVRLTGPVFVARYWL